MAYLSSLPDLPEIVRDSRLNATFHTDGRESYIVHQRGGAHRRARETQDVWVHERHLGAGGYGRVDVQAKRTAEAGKRELRAVKTILISDTELRSRRDFYVRELEAIIKFSQVRYDDLFVKTFGWYASDNHLFIAMEYCPLGDLHQYLKSTPNRRLPEDQTREIASQVLDALSRMHEEGFAHRDLKPQNILIKKQPPETWTVKLSDFGISRRNRNEEAPMSPVTVRGTGGFMPPELLNANNDASRLDLYAADMWCAGETIFRILTGRPTFETTADLYGYYFKVGQFPAQALRDAGVSEQAVAFLASLVVCSPGERLTARQALVDPWVMMAVPESPVFKFSESLAVSRSYTNLFRPAVESHLQQVFEDEASGSWDTQTQQVGRVSEDGLELQIPSRKAITAKKPLEPVKNRHQASSSLEEPVSGSWSTGTLHNKSQSMDIPQTTTPPLQRQKLVKRPGAAPRRRHTKDTDDMPIERTALAQQETRLQQEANEHLRKGQYEDAAWLLQELSTLKSKLPGIESGPDHETMEHEKLDVVAQHLRLAATEADRRRAMGYLAITLFKMDMFVSAEYCYLDFIRREKEALAEPGAQFDFRRAEPKCVARLDSFLIDLAHTLVRQEKLDEAVGVYEEVTAHKKMLLGAAHQETVDVMYELADVLKGAGRYVEARQIHRDVIESRRARLGETNALTLESRARLQKLEEVMQPDERPPIYQEQPKPKPITRKSIPVTKTEPTQAKDAQANDSLAKDTYSRDTHSKDAHAKEVDGHAGDEQLRYDKDRGSKDVKRSFSPTRRESNPPIDQRVTSKPKKSSRPWRKVVLCGFRG